MAVFQIDFPAIMSGELSQVQELQQMKSYLYRLHECLQYAFNHIDGSNMTEEARRDLAASRTAAVKIRDLTETEREEMERIARGLRAEIIASADTVASDTKKYVDDLATGQLNTIATMYVAKTSGDEDDTVAELKEFVSKSITDTSQEWTARFQDITEMTKAVGEDLKTYQEELATYIRLDINGITIGKENSGETVPYTVVIDNEKMSFQYMGHEVAYIQYNKLYITSAEFLDRISIGSTANGGFFDFITTLTGMGLKWRDA